MEDRSALFSQLKNFSQRKLKKVETKVVTASGEQLVEKRGAKGLQVLTGQDASKGEDAEPPRKLDLQVGLIVPGLLIGSQDVAHDKSSLESYGVTHILNLDSGVENKFEDDYNYKDVHIQDRPDFELEKILEDCFDFIDDGRHYGNVFVHCSGTIGLSRSTSICIAYLMSKEKQKFEDAFNNVKEARSFVKPNEGFVKQLKDYEVKLRGAQEVKDSGIDDPFALRKKQEIEQEKAMVAGAASVKNRMKMFGANLDAGSNNSSRSKSVSPSPFKQPSSSNSNSVTSNQSSSNVSKWSASNRDLADNNKLSSKSMTPEPKKSWQIQQEASPDKQDWRAQSKPTSGPPPPPPPMPQNLLGDDKSAKRSSPLPPPPAPPLPSGHLLKEFGDKWSKPATSNNEPQTEQRQVFGRVKPPAMKIKGGLSIERQDTTGDSNSGFKNTTSQSTKTSLQLPLKKQPTIDQGSDPGSQDSSRAPSPSAALRAAKQQAAARLTDSSQKEKPNDMPRPSVCGQLNRSSTKKLLNLIKTKTKSDLTLPDGDENDEIEALLGALETESIENIDWDELGLDEDEVKDIIQKGTEMGSSSSSSEEEEEEEEEEDDDDDDDDDDDEEVESSSQHFVIRTK